MAGRVTRNGFNQSDLVDLLRRLRNYNHAAIGAALPNLAPAAAPADIQSTAIIVASVDGVQVHKAVTAVLVDLPGAFGLVDTAAGESTVVLIQMDSAGVITLKQGPRVVGGVGDTLTSVPLPLPAAGVTVIGAILIAGTAHVWGTTALTAAMLKDGDPFLRPNVNLAGHGNVGLES